MRCRFRSHTNHVLGGEERDLGRSPVHIDHRRQAG